MTVDNKDYYDEFAAAYEARRRPNDPHGYHALIDDLEIEIVERYAKDKTVLECGCGTGLLLERIAHFAKRAQGIDLSPGMLDKARARGLDVREASVTSIPFPDASFDVACSFKVLAHVEDIRRALSEMARVTKPGGVVCGLNEGTRGVFRSSENPDQEGEKALGINEHVHSVWAYLYAFTRAGLTVRRLERPDGWPPSPYGRRLSKIPKVGLALGTLAHLSAAHYAGVSIYARKRGGDSAA